MRYTLEQIMDTVELSAAGATTSMAECEKIIEFARKYKPRNIAGLHWNTEVFVKYAKEIGVHSLGPVASGGGMDTTEYKVECAREQLAAGLDEIDCSMNIPLLRSHRYTECYEDIKAIADVAREAGKVCKCIIEAPILTDEEIAVASLLVMDAGFDYVKGGTAFWGITSVEKTLMMANAVHGDCGVKGAGITNLDDLMTCMDNGVDRFGLGMRFCGPITEEYLRREAEESEK